MKRLLLGLCVGAVLIGATSAVRAQSVINFDDLTFNNYDYLSSIAPDYGDRLPGTPNVLASFRSPGSPTNPNDISLWDNNYGNLSKVGFATQNGYNGEVELKPDAGYAVILDSFDLAGWPNVDRKVETLQVLDGNGNVLWDMSGDIVLGGTAPFYSHYTPGVSSTSGLIIRWGQDWDIGIDNIQFNQRQVGQGEVPEPGALALLMGAAVSMGLFVRRRARR
jgi:hypothetical protein